MKKLFLTIIMISLLLAGDNCQKYLKKSLKYLNDGYIIRDKIYYQLKASNYLKLYELCKKYHLKINK